MLSSWHSSTNLSSIQIFHSDGKRPDSNSIVPWKCPFPFVDVHFYNKICHVLKGQMPGLGQMWDPVMIFTCQIPDFAPGGGGGGGGGGSHVTMIGALYCWSSSFIVRLVAFSLYCWSSPCTVGLVFILLAFSLYCWPSPYTVGLLPILLALLSARIWCTVGLLPGLFKLGANQGVDRGWERYDVWDGGGGGGWGTFLGGNPTLLEVFDLRL